MAAAAGFGAVLGIAIPFVGGLFGRLAAKYLGPKLRPILDKLLRKGRGTPKPTLDLDGQFGAPKPPGGTRGVKPFEMTPEGNVIKNPTLQKPGPGNPPKLDPNKEYIWAIDKDGKLLIGEEVKTGVVETNGYVQKLGHPTLTEGGEARIAGEIRQVNGKWVINNRSGRYSAHPDRGSDQLKNASGLFEDSGLPVGTDFKPMTP
jgi:hypothetical protein